ncbi:MAG: integrase catalytic domain-containing protein [Saprospiraceae bacterium]|nr:integrase catalytic domain-containing protein [Saprospiraceae bacterium]
MAKGKLTIPSSKADKRKFLVAEEIEKLMAYNPRNETERKVMMIVRFNLHVGMRIGDVLTLRKKDVIQGEHPTRGTIFRLVKTTSKTETDINVMLTAQAADQIVEAGYFKKESDLIFPWLKEEDFANDFILYKAISSKTTLFNKTLAQICKNVGIKHISSHSLRHTFCTTLVSKGVPLASIAKLVGHTDITTTMIYSQILQEAADDAISVLED